MENSHIIKSNMFINKPKPDSDLTEGKRNKAARKKLIEKLIVAQINR